MGKTARVAGALGILLCCAATVARSQTHPSLSPALRDLAVSDIVVPAELGYVVERHEPAAAASSRPIIVHIQEAHSNYEAQQHLVGILERLIERCALKLILVEGGEGDVSLAYLRGYGPLEHRKQVAEEYLKAGVLSAEEYLDIVSDSPLILWGVEEDTLYQQNVAAFVEADSLQASLKPVLALVRESAEALTPRLFSAALLELEEQAKAFEQGTLDLGGYAERLGRVADRQGISLEASPNFARLLSARALEGLMQPATLQQEQQVLMDQLTRQADPEPLQRLLAQSRAVRDGTLTQEAFCASLEALATASGISLAQYPTLTHYIRYIEESAQIQPSALAEELDQLAARLRTVLASTPESQTLQTLLAQLDLMEKLVELRLSPEEYQRFQALSSTGEWLARWDTFLTEQLAHDAMPVPSFHRLEELNAALPTLERFYEAAHRRDAVLVEHAMAKVAETGEPIAVLITGGFHSPKITQLLKEQGVGLVVVAPRVSQATDERLYRAVLRYKSGHGTFEEVQAAVNGELASHQGVGTP